jgi:hypothetical protein
MTIAIVDVIREILETLKNKNYNPKDWILMLGSLFSETMDLLSCLSQVGFIANEDFGERCESLSSHLNAVSYIHELFREV